MMTSDRQIPDAIANAAHATPSLLVIAMTWLDVTPERWLTRLGIVFLLLQIAYMAWRWRRDAKRGVPPVEGG